METINAVNFEDLFDFSPEPVDRHSHEEREFQPSSLDIPPTKAPPNSYVSPSTSVNIKASLNTANRNTGDVFADFDAITSGLLGGTDLNETEVKSSSTSQEHNFEKPFIHQSHHSNKQSGGHLQLSSSVPVHWSNSEGPDSKYSNSELTSNYSQKELQNTSSQQVNERSNFAVAASITALLKDLPEESLKNIDLKGDSNRSSLDEPPQQPVKSKRGRKPGQTNLKTDMKSKLERSRQSARECRARKKLRYQYLDDLILERERANCALRDELIKYQKWCHELDKGRIPEGMNEMLQKFKEEKSQNR